MDGTYLFLKQYERVAELDTKVDIFDKQPDDVKNALKMLDMDPHTLLEKEVLELSTIYEDNEYGGIDKRIVRDTIGHNYIALYEHLPVVYKEIFEYYGGKKRKNHSIKRKRKSRKTRSKNTLTNKRSKKVKRKTRSRK